MEVAIPLMLKCKTFDDYIATTETEITIEEIPVDIKQSQTDLVRLHNFIVPERGIAPEGEKRQEAYWGVFRGKRTQMNGIAKSIFDYKYEDLRKTAGV